MYPGPPSTGCLVRIFCTNPVKELDRKLQACGDMVYTWASFSLPYHDLGAAYIYDNSTWDVLGGTRGLQGSGGLLGSRFRLHGMNRFFPTPSFACWVQAWHLTADQ